MSVPDGCRGPQSFVCTPSLRPRVCDGRSLNKVSHVQCVPTSRRYVGPMKSDCASCTSVVPVHWYIAIRSPVNSSGSLGLS